MTEIKLCECGCGLPVPIAKSTERRTGAIRGQPQRFIRGHSTKLRSLRPTKYCWVCKQTFPRTAEFFYRCKGTGDGLGVKCKTCSKIASKEFAARHKEQTATYHREYHKKNSIKKQAYAKAYRDANGEKLKEQIREWGLKNFEKVREYAKRRKWKYRESLIAGHHKRRAAEKKVASEKIDYGKVYNDHKGVCGICDKPVDRLKCHFDHIVPIDKQGGNTAANLQPTHSKCNRIKGNRTLEYARERIIKLRELGDNV